MIDVQFTLSVKVGGMSPRWRSFPHILRGCSGIDTLNYRSSRPCALVALPIRGWLRCHAYIPKHGSPFALAAVSCHDLCFCAPTVIISLERYARQRQSHLRDLFGPMAYSNGVDNPEEAQATVGLVV